MKLIFLDTETTGNDVKKDRLTQVCYKHGDKTVNELFKPPVDISIKSQAITHITPKMVADKPPFKDSPTYKELEKILPNNIMVAHNAPFDIAILEAEGLSVPQAIDTLRLARHLDTAGVIPEYNLQYLRYYLELEVANANAHDALGDVLVLEALFAPLKAKVEKQVRAGQPAIDKMLELSATPVLIKKFSFGKHIDKTLEQVVEEDPGYLQWLLKQKNENPDGEEDWLYTLNYYLNNDPDQNEKLF